MNTLAKIRSLVVTAGLLAAGTLIFARPQQFDHELMVVETEANAGNPEAQFLLGLRYGAGEGVREDPARAENWLRVAADAGLVEAQSALGEFYLLVGPGYEREAEKWLEVAADRGDAPSRALLESFSAPASWAAPASWREVSSAEPWRAGSAVVTPAIARTGVAFAARAPTGGPTDPAAGATPIVSLPAPDAPSKSVAPATAPLPPGPSIGWEAWILGVIAVATLAGIWWGRRS